MQVVDAVRFVKRQFGDEYDIVINNDDIYQWFYDAEMQIIRETASNKSVVTPAGSSFPVSVPDSVNISRVEYKGVALTHIWKEELDLVRAQTTLSEGGPQYWYRYNKSVHLWPAYTGSDLLTIEYSKIPVLMAGDPSVNTFIVPEPYHNDIIKYALSRAHNKNNNHQGEQVERDKFDRNLSLRADEAQGIDGPIYKMGDPMDYSDYPSFSNW